MINIPKTVLSGAEKLGVPLSKESAGLFELYYKILADHAGRFNLTTVTDPQGVAYTHFLDSLALLTVADFSEADVIDIGSGAGFPGVPIKIAVPSARLTLLDATRKRVDFLSHLCLELGLDVRCVHARAEEILHGAKLADGRDSKNGKNSKSSESSKNSKSGTNSTNSINSEDGGNGEKFREQFDIAVSRAVASLNVLCELCLPFVRVGGTFLAMKGVESEKEISEALTAIKTLGGSFDKKVDYTIPDVNGGEITHSIVVIRKTEPTSEKYPRRFAKITKSPL